MAHDPFDVRLTRQAEKDIRDLRPWADRILRALQSLKQDPGRGHALRRSLAGVRSLEFSLPGGAHRAIYVVIEDERVCLVFLVGAHEGIYERAERRVQALRHQGTV
ncbi:MAG: cytotoxic translational repressor of toxin-antitoxin stability system [Chloroflexi bacterium]|nr:cytotoxic translational repressor of toxin-antitoxin stability system [Chloroflexota bacterium]